MTYCIACDFVLGLKDLLKQADEVFDPAISAAHAAHKAAIAAKKKVTDPITEAERTIKPKIAAYELEQRRKAEEERRRAEEEARKQREAELEAAIEEAEADGASADEVQAIIQQPIVMPQIKPVPSFKPVKGVATRCTYRAEVYDARALYRAVADGSVSPNLVAPNMTALNQMARAMRDTMNIPGVRAVPDVQVAAGRR